jgi:transglutaminase-like putative cysteine protease
MMQRYLESSHYIDWNTQNVLAQAQELASGRHGTVEIAKACCEFVRDDIKHSWDYELNPVTCKASDVLHYGTGYCYAKSHLLAALLRANHIPAGVCYQRLSLENEASSFCLHGLNAVFLEDYGWYRLDARGNKPGVDADFCPPLEKLAFPLRTTGEADLLEIWSEPLERVVRALEKHRTYWDVAHNLPDIEVIRSEHVP